ncbi:hypothetical protein DFH27DRAFT_521342 [Peziza echinospora]|nr:hypothetical protein DFH27DRAFT_521342 [Peziza echinospora]
MSRPKCLDRVAGKGSRYMPWRDMESSQGAPTGRMIFGELELDGLDAIGTGGWGRPEMEGTWVAEGWASWWLEWEWRPGDTLLAWGAISIAAMRPFYDITHSTMRQWDNTIEPLRFTATTATLYQPLEPLPGLVCDASLELAGRTASRTLAPSPPAALMHCGVDMSRNPGQHTGHETLRTRAQIPDLITTVRHQPARQNTCDGKTVGSMSEPSLEVGAQSQI